MNHVCNGNPAHGKVCSHLATPAVLADLGFTVKVVDKVVGTPVVVVPGVTLEAARHAAFAAGKVRVCTKKGAA